MFYKLLKWVRYHLMSVLLLLSGLLVSLLAVFWILPDEMKFPLFSSAAVNIDSQSSQSSSEGGLSFTGKVDTPSKIKSSSSELSDNSKDFIPYDGGIYVGQSLDENRFPPLWSSDFDDENLFLNEDYIDAKADLDLETQILSQPLALDQDKLKSLKVGDEIALEIPHLGTSYGGVVVEATSRNGISTIHGDLLGELGDFLEVFVFTIGDDDSGGGVIFTNNGTYDVQINKGYAWITNNNERPKKTGDDSENVTAAINEEFASNFGKEFGEALSEGLQNLAADIEQKQTEFYNSRFNMSVSDIEKSEWSTEIRSYLLDGRNLISWQEALDYLNSKGLLAD